MSQFPISIRAFGEQAVLLEWPEQVEETILDDILQFSHHLKTHHLDPLDWEFVPAYNSLALISRKGKMDFRNFKRELLAWYKEARESAMPDRYLWKLPVCYHTDFGIDLVEVAEKLGKNVWEVIELHTRQAYRVYGIGFLPGFMYLGGLPGELEVPRRQEPRLKVEAGSVGLAGKQTGIYPQQSPGGWNIIGNCPIPVFDPNKEEPCFVRVGDKVQFYGISPKEHELFTIQAEVGIYNMEKVKLNA